MRRTSMMVAAGLALFLSVPVAAADGPAVHTAHLTELNASGVVGQAVLTMDGSGLEVNLTVAGTERNLLHVQHIHGLAQAMAECPTLARDVNRDGFVDVAEGLPDYGPVLLSLRPFPTANPGGVVKTHETYTTVDSGAPVSALMPLESRVMVIHGLDVNGNGRYDGGFETAMPVACGHIEPRG